MWLVVFGFISIQGADETKMGEIFTDEEEAELVQELASASQKAKKSTWSLRSLFGASSHRKKVERSASAPSQEIVFFNTEEGSSATPSLASVALYSASISPASSSEISEISSPSVSSASPLPASKRARQRMHREPDIKWMTKEEMAASDAAEEAYREKQRIFEQSTPYEYASFFEHEDREPQRASCTPMSSFQTPSPVVRGVKKRKGIKSDSLAKHFSRVSASPFREGRFENVEIKRSHSSLPKGMHSVCVRSLAQDFEAGIDQIEEDAEAAAAKK